MCWDRWAAGLGCVVVWFKFIWCWSKGAKLLACVDAKSNSNKSNQWFHESAMKLILIWRSVLWLKEAEATTVDWPSASQELKALLAKPTRKQAFQVPFECVVKACHSSRERSQAQHCCQEGEWTRNKNKKKKDTHLMRCSICICHLQLAKRIPSDPKGTRFDKTLA